MLLSKMDELKGHKENHKDQQAYLLLVSCSRIDLEEYFPKDQCLPKYDLMYHHYHGVVRSTCLGSFQCYCEKINDTLFDPQMQDRDQYRKRLLYYLYSLKISHTLVIETIGHLVAAICLFGHLPNQHREI